MTEQNRPNWRPPSPRLPLAVAGGCTVAGWVAALAWLVGIGDAELPASSLRTLLIVVLLIVSLAAFAVAVHVAGLYRRLAQESEELRRLAATDPLTGALNYSEFIEVFEREFARCRRYGQPLALLMLDIDFFRRINDGYGHAVGDATLKAFVATLLQGLRNVDAIGRLGGKDFAVLLPNTPLEPAAALADRLRDRVANIMIPTEPGDIVRITASVGVTAIDRGDNAADQMRARAVSGLQRAKANGRNRVEAVSAETAVAAKAPAGQG